MSKNEVEQYPETSANRPVEKDEITQMLAVLSMEIIHAFERDPTSRKAIEHRLLDVMSAMNSLWPKDHPFGVLHQETLVEYHQMFSLAYPDD